MNWLEPPLTLACPAGCSYPDEPLPTNNKLLLRTFFFSSDAGTCSLVFIVSQSIHTHKQELFFLSLISTNYVYDNQKQVWFKFIIFFLLQVIAICAKRDTPTADNRQTSNKTRQDILEETNRQAYVRYKGGKRGRKIKERCEIMARPPPSPVLRTAGGIRRAAGREGGGEEGVGLLSIDLPTPTSFENGLQTPMTGGMRTPRTPRTPNRVRFDLTPTVVVDSSSSNRNPPPRPAAPFANTDIYHHGYDEEGDARESFEFSASATGRNTESRAPLLTGITAPSVQLATNIPDLDSLRRPKSSLPSAFMNMANSIIGAGIIGQPYAIRQAGLLTGTVLLILLTVIVDWTIRLIVINSKLSGATSFQGTVEKCFGRSGLIAISVAQWAFAFGGMVAFGVIVGDSIPHVIGAIWPGWNVDRRWVIGILTLGVSYPLALYRDIAMLAKASGFALVSMGVIVATVIVQSGFVEEKDRGKIEGGWVVGANWEGVVSAVGVISFGEYTGYKTGRMRGRNGNGFANEGKTKQLSFAIITVC